jgi:plastocyanin
LRAILAVVIAMFLPAVAAAEPTGACSPSGTALSISAKDKTFDKDCLAAPADQAFTIEFDNQDPAVPHNVAIYDVANGNKALFKGEVFFGPNKMTYSVPAQASGTYEFRCDPHDDTMIGTFIVGDGKAAAPPPSTPPSSTTTTTGPFGLPELPLD